MNKQQEHKHKHYNKKQHQVIDVKNRETQVLGVLLIACQIEREVENDRFSK
jgi:hypothetical protein